MKKLLYLPLIDTTGANEQWDLLGAFRGRFHTVVLDYRAVEDPHRDLLALLVNFEPDIVHGQFQDTRVFYPHRLADIRKARPSVRWSQWCGDVRNDPIQHVIDLGKVLDLTLVSARGMVLPYQEQIGKKVAHWDHAVGERFFTSPCESDGSIIFCGHNYDCFPGSEERRRLVGALKQAFPERMRIYGGGWEDEVQSDSRLPWELQPSVYRRAVCTVGINNYNDRDGYFSDRQFICMASGVPHVCRHVPGIEDFLEPGKEVLTFITQEEAVSQVQWVIDHPTEAAALGRAGKERVRREHTWEARLTQYEGYLEGLRA